MAGQRNQFRIIGGQWRGRKLGFFPAPGLRPTPDRVRETLFNWLAPVIDGARVLDLFAGSGALGFEAASRGASQVTLVDSHPRVISQLQQNIRLLQAPGMTTCQSEALRYLERPAEPCDIVFLDPPYQSRVLEACFIVLEASWLSREAWIYYEYDSHMPSPALPANWQVSRSKQAGQVAYQLARRQPTQ
ncbi:16S rRNA (guanine(966)-N(2))-methyltransferase RsmD [Thiohalophilus sp.]|uniref:16S rRNA (guanine(966)-N(2))-methyltransferase RsmD n=1 Tax=Thiohalophilus sp. TaxID=3028392 RepID=UPI0039762E79